MPKHVCGIVIDVYAAHDIMERANPPELAKVAQMRADQKLALCPDEELTFHQDSLALSVWGNQPPNYLAISDDVWECCDDIACVVPPNRFLGNSRVQINVAAIAKPHGYGVVSLHVSGSFATVAECCAVVGVHCWTPISFFHEFNNIVFV